MKVITCGGFPTRWFIPPSESHEDIVKFDSRDLHCKQFKILVIWLKQRNPFRGLPSKCFCFLFSRIKKVLHFLRRLANNAVFNHTIWTNFLPFLNNSWFRIGNHPNFFLKYSKFAFMYTIHFHPPFLKGHIYYMCVHTCVCFVYTCAYIHTYTHFNSSSKHTAFPTCGVLFWVLYIY